jgi:hypothetical protein
MGSFHNGQSEIEARPFSPGRFNPDPATMSFDDFFADGEAHARARIFLPGVQPLENYKNPREVFWINSYPVVANDK